jgi:hypothetical protein
MGARASLEISRSRDDRARKRAKNLVTPTRASIGTSNKSGKIRNTPRAHAQGLLLQPTSHADAIFACSLRKK